MNGGDALAALLGRVAAGSSEPAHFAEGELAEWPAAAVAALKAAGLLVKGPPADVVGCPGCEEDCAMPVETAATAGGKVRAFVVCDRRDDVARVEVPRDLLEQWTCSPERVADALARLLGTRRSGDGAAGGRWDVGMLKGAKGAAHVVLGIAGHNLALADVLDLGDNSLTLDRRALTRCVDSPVGAAGDSAARENRVDRLRKRRNELRAARVRNFNQVLAKEEGVSVSAIKQALAEKKPATNWLGLSPAPKATVPKKPKTRS
ncbi:MAG: hypothetical protein HYZ17_01065 [Betaproteobacteria bacterium]|nr:hypothetical protein [Betaproteobacteria bacterium]